MIKIMPILEDARCTVCSRFIPHGTTARWNNGLASCLTHAHGFTPLDKGGYTPEATAEIVTARSKRDIKRRRREFAESLAPQHPLSFELI